MKISNASMGKRVGLRTVFLFFTILHTASIYAYDSCCGFHHFNRCDQTIDRVVCDDGTLSPSCTCESILNQPVRDEDD